MPNQDPQATQYAKMTSEELNNLLDSVSKKIALSTAQVASITSDAKVNVDRQNKQIATFTAMKASIQEAIDAKA